MKTLLTLFLFLSSFFCLGQTLQKFHLNFATGLVSPTGTNSSVGFLLAVEPKIGFSKHIDIGLRYESAFSSRALPTAYYNSKIDDSQTTQSLLFTSTVTASGKSIRPFVGAGLGLYFMSYPQVGAGTGFGTPGAGGKSFGGAIRGGVKLKRLVLSIDYNVVPTTEMQRIIDSYFSGYRGGDINVMNYYLAFKIGIDAGGLWP